MKTTGRNSSAILALFILSSSAGAQETVYPSGTDVTAAYQLSSTDFSVGDTLIITRTITNNESYDLANLYMSEVLPSEFDLVSFSIEINNTAISHHFSGAVSHEYRYDCNSFRWAIDLPDSGDSLNNLLSAGDTLLAQYAVVCSAVGEYTLPFHSFCAYGGGTGIFSLADSQAITVSPAVAIFDQTLPLPDNYLKSRAYPNPFNGEVRIDFDLMDPAAYPIRLEIYDLLGRKISEMESGLRGRSGSLFWRPEKNVASGVYIYYLAVRNVVSKGTMTFLK